MSSSWVTLKRVKPHSKCSLTPDLSLNQRVDLILQPTEFHPCEHNCCHEWQNTPPHQAKLGGTWSTWNSVCHLHRSTAAQVPLFSRELTMPLTRHGDVDCARLLCRYLQRTKPGTSTITAHAKAGWWSSHRNSQLFLLPPFNISSPNVANNNPTFNDVVHPAPNLNLR